MGPVVVERDDRQVYRMGAMTIKADDVGAGQSSLEIRGRHRPGPQRVNQRIGDRSIERSPGDPQGQMGCRAKPPSTTDGFNPVPVDVGSGQLDEIPEEDQPKPVIQHGMRAQERDTKGVGNLPQGPQRRLGQLDRPCPCLVGGATSRLAELAIGEEIPMEVDVEAHSALVLEDHIPLVGLWPFGRNAQGRRISRKMLESGVQVGRRDQEVKVTVRPLVRSSVSLGYRGTLQDGHSDASLLEAGENPPKMPIENPCSRRLASRYSTNKAITGRVGQDPDEAVSLGELDQTCRNLVSEIRWPACGDVDQGPTDWIPSAERPNSSCRCYQTPARLSVWRVTATVSWSVARTMRSAPQ